jgi:hypothetical protein
VASVVVGVVKGGAVVGGNVCPAMVEGRVVGEVGLGVVVEGGAGVVGLGRVLCEE